MFSHFLKLISYFWKFWQKKKKKKHQKNHFLAKISVFGPKMPKFFSFNPFLPTCFKYQIHSAIEHSHDIGTAKNHWSRIQETLKLSIFYLISFTIMVGFKAKARVSSYFTKLGWRCGCIFVGGVCRGVCMCVCVRGGYICAYGWVC